MTDDAALLDPGQDLVAYICAEFGVDEHLVLYAGGLGARATTSKPRVIWACPSNNAGRGIA